MAFRPKRKLIKAFDPVVKRTLFWYFRKRRKWTYKSMTFVIEPGVFFPHFTYSTRALLDFLETLDLEKKTLLDIGCGSGVLSVFAAKRLAKVTAIDISELALENTRLNARKHDVEIEIQQSNLMESVDKDRRFDVVIINPPYYPKNPESVSEFAWFCGENFDYFEQLFGQLAERNEQIGNIFMVLSEDCDLERIQTIAADNGWQMVRLTDHRDSVETNFIFRITRSLN